MLFRSEQLISLCHTPFTTISRLLPQVIVIVCCYFIASSDRQFHVSCCVIVVDMVVDPLALATEPVEESYLLLLVSQF